MTKTKIGIAGGIASVALGASSVAWACTPQLPLTVKPEGGSPSGAVTASGRGSPGPVEFRWDSVDGPVVGTAPDGSSYSVGIRIPDAAPGVHTIVAVTRGQDGQFKVKGQAPFKVLGDLGPSARTVSADLWSGSAPADKATSNSPLASPASANDSNHLAMGLGLLGTGLVALVSGVGVAELRRRKATVAATSG